MPDFKVKWARAASGDLEEIVAYIALDSAHAAEKLLLKLESRARTLESYPRRGRVVPELARYNIRGYRELMVPPYRILYRISGGMVVVLGIFDGRRDLDEVILHRLFREG